jgi:peptide/nickel transport system permease protein
VFFLGTDDQGRDLLSAIMFGSRVSLLVGLVSVIFAMLIGVSLGLLAGYAAGRPRRSSCASPTSSCRFRRS